MQGGESQSTSQGTNTSGNESGSGSGSGSGSTPGHGTVIGGGTPIITADDLAKQTASDLTTAPLTLSEQIAANFASLSGLIGNTDQTGGGAYPVPVPVAAPSSTSSLTWILLAGAAVAAYFIFFHKKGGQNGE